MDYSELGIIHVLAERRHCGPVMVNTDVTRLVLLVDNSLTIRADVKKLEQAPREFAYEIYEGDKLLIVGYDEEAERS